MAVPSATSGPHLRANVVAAKARLAEGREKLKQRHLKGTPGNQVCGAMTDLLDTIVLDLYETALVELGETGPNGLGSEVTLVPHGGYGRRDVAPYSDVDLMILHTPAVAKRVTRLAERLVRDVFDVGLTLGQSVRTPQQACDLARQDATICTSLIESRYLVGSVHVFTRFSQRFQQTAQRHSRSLITQINEARSEERLQFGETVYLLEPNIKRSQGGLRDIQLLRWVGFARYGTAEPDGLRLCGALSREDHDAIRRALEFLLRLRNEMHFSAGKSNDVLDRVEQVRLAEVFGFEGTEGLLPVEQFMREYFRLTNAVSHVVTPFVAGARGSNRLARWLAPLLSHQFERDFRVGPTQIVANRRGLAKLKGNLEQVLRLVDLANRYNKSIGFATYEVIRSDVRNLSDEITPAIAERFISVLSQPARLGELLRALHEIGVLEKIIPNFVHARCLLQFNDYHKYTVDEHSLRAVERATEFLKDRGPLGKVYQRIKRKWLLHLALLIHDLGKGFAEDHSELGLKIAEDLARRLYLAEHDAETLKFLVHKHLMMSHLAFRRDTSDAQLILRFAVEVGSPETLQMLFVLTAADLAAVGPGVLNAWKIEVLADLYHRAMAHLAGDAPDANPEVGLIKRRGAILRLLQGEEGWPWFEKQLAVLPASYLYSTPPQQIATDLRQLHRLTPGHAMAEGRYQKETNTIEYRVGTHEQIGPGIFHKLTGALTSQGLQILSAEIHTLADGLVFDRFYVHDTDFNGEPPADRLEDVSQKLVAALKNPDSPPPAFRRLWRPDQLRRNAVLRPLPTQVRVDNSTSDRYTILDIFTHDRMGLLYTIAGTLLHCGLSVAVAKIGTYLDQVVDVFYVTDQEGHKISDEDRLRDLRARLLADIEELARRENEPPRRS
jgi:[protein-PII] uridylyltransferase